MKVDYFQSSIDYVRVYRISGMIPQFPSRAIAHVSQIEGETGNGMGPICKDLLRKIFDIPFVNFVIIVQNFELGSRISIQIDDHCEFDRKMPGMKESIHESIMRVMNESAECAEALPLSSNIPPFLLKRDARRTGNA